MGKNNKPKVSSKPINPISTLKINGNQQLVLAYNYLDINSKKYSMDTITNNKDAIYHYKNFYEKLKEYCEKDNFKKYIAVHKDYSKKNHIHPIDWNDSQIRESSFTCLSEDLMRQIKGECWQLGIDNQGFRIHGFFIENVFYIVWLDPDHLLYKRK